ncbi:cytochrome d ubiquinol oxidase subunit II [Paenibacillus ehimensis]|uniref:Cytochrome d ubiquinol oxidase subunit II n=1 Tax=Paenibacillus ehimensis TaxID=79264 RepID=A0ABT8V9T1_9BACL|nr:cytochrome d ubiquinol oxidase subunit II [Paenibacillus ehimensis]MDO3677615.1 cytochrome d ubiquinol oxidase subunit II [Paenibacillus ehimensis]MEC0208894.1 cytochrome d ubiquinol oxidase subunit II [Paenibacillus ehimensis]
MSNVTIAILILWVFIFVYSILGSIDFGTGFWAMLFDSKKPPSNAAVIANRFLSPTWKVTNVFLVLLVVALVGFFPRSMYMLADVLVLPVGLVLLLLTIRSTFMVYAFAIRKFSRLLIIVSGLTGLLIPALLVSVLPVSLGGFVAVVNGVPRLEIAKLFTSPTEYAHLGFGLATELFLSAVFLADYSREAEDEHSYTIYRQLAVALGPATLGMAILTTVTMAPEASWIVEGFRREWLWFSLSVAAFTLGYSALFWKRRDGRVGSPRWTVTAVVLQYALASFAYGAAHMPYLIYPYLTVEQGFTNPTMFVSLLIGYAVSSVVLAPVFYWFWRLFLKDKRYLKPDGTS